MWCKRCQRGQRDDRLINGRCPDCGSGLIKTVFPDSTHNREDSSVKIWEDVSDTATFTEEGICLHGTTEADRKETPGEKPNVLITDDVVGDIRSVEKVRPKKKRRGSKKGRKLSEETKKKMKDAWVKRKQDKGSASAKNAEGSATL